MNIPQLTSCCCGCSLKTGSKIIGWLHLITRIFALIVVSTFGLLQISKMSDDKDKWVALVVIALTVLILGFLLGLSIMLLVGVYKEKTTLLKVWVVIELICAVLAFIHVIKTDLLGSGHPESLVELIPLGIGLYFILVVYSFYREIGDIPHSGLIH